MSNVHGWAQDLGALEVATSLIDDLALATLWRREGVWPALISKVQKREENEEPMLGGVGDRNEGGDEGQRDDGRDTDPIFAELEDQLCATHKEGILSSPLLATATSVRARARHRKSYLLAFTRCLCYDTFRLQICPTGWPESRWAGRISDGEESSSSLVQAQAWVLAANLSYRRFGGSLEY
ncbi:hypothetical protein PQX77_013187 [Marasmius sp. AFHP31]|nr:hypothetical protein PQX77_013187 [Marasmius sp. AFHP31]